MTQEYIEDDAYGPSWRLQLGDSCVRMSEWETESVHLSVHSPPFAQLFVYSDSDRDMGNNPDRAQFLEHYRFVVEHLLRATRPGRLACVHVQDLTTTKASDGYISVTDFSGDLIKLYQDVGWLYQGRTTVQKDPQLQARRTKAQALMFKTKNTDSARTRPALADYLLLFSKPGDNAEPIRTDVTNSEWIEWAAPVWLDAHDGGDLGGEHLPGAWLGIRESETLSAREARDEADERHIAPLQLDFIARCVRLWSNPGELVATPCGGIGTESYVAVKLGRRALSCELKPIYWRQSVKTLRSLDVELSAPALFDHAESAS